MRRRPLLAALGASAIGSAAGCLGGLADTGPSDRPEPLGGRYQWGYDARNSNYAVGLAGPTDTPAIQRLYTDVDSVPLTTDDALYFPTSSVGFDGGRRWENLEGSGSRLYEPAIYEDSVVGAGYDSETFWALSMVDGGERWQVDLSQSRTRRIKVRDDHAYFATTVGIGCVDLEAQEEAWQIDLVEINPFEDRAFWLTPAVGPEHVFTVSQDTRDPDAPQVVYAVDRDAGDLDWTTEIEGGAAHFSAPIVGDDYVFVTSAATDPPDAEGEHNWTQILAIDPGNGDVVWREALAGTSHHVIDCGHAVADGMLYIGHGVVNEDRPPAELSAINTADGSTEWVTNVWSHGLVSLTVTDELIYVADSYYYRALDRDGGDEIWSINLIELLADTDSESELRPLPSHPVVQDGRLFVYLGDGEVVGLW